MVAVISASTAVILLWWCPHGLRGYARLGLVVRDRHPILADK